MNCCFFFQCVALSGLGFRRGSYKCVCKHGFYYPDTKAERRYYNGTVIEEEYEKLMLVIPQKLNFLVHFLRRSTFDFYLLVFKGYFIKIKVF